MKGAETIVRVVLFYLLTAIAVLLISPLFGPYTSYLVIIALSLIFMAISKIAIKPGNPIPGLAAGSLAIVTVFLIMLSAGGITVNGLNINYYTPNIIIGGVLFQIFVALGEELSFRQYIFADLERATGTTPAAAISALGFAAMHLPSIISLETAPTEAIIALTTISIAGVILALLFIKGGLLAAAGFHFAWNFLQYSVLGLGDMSSVLNVTKTGSALINGAAYGPEASIPGLIVIGAVLVSIWYIYGGPVPKTQHV
ncbi:MAG TPA: CPBP family intramembrane glutamic endopeptidase [Methanocella sp.]|nr:CPBP family intramembrane glutamic endopeptidase [Methanocella sp.]